MVKDATEALRLEQGTRLDSYEIVQFIGAGGFGEVYEVRDRIGRTRALKMLRPDVLRDGPAQIENFNKEARRASEMAQKSQRFV